MGRPIQVSIRCVYYTPNKNLNKVCQNRMYCVTSYDIQCPNYKEKEDGRDRRKI